MQPPLILTVTLGGRGGVGGYIITPALQRGKLRHRKRRSLPKVTELARGSQNLTLGRLALESMLLARKIQTHQQKSDRRGNSKLYAFICFASFHRAPPPARQGATGRRWLGVRRMHLPHTVPAPQSPYLILLH